MVVAASSILSLQVAGVAFNMMRVEGGLFQMGSKQLGQEPWQVSVDPFWIMETHVTNELMDAYIADMGERTHGTVGLRNHGQGFVLGRIRPDEDRSAKVLSSARPYLEDMAAYRYARLVPRATRYDDFAATLAPGRSADLFKHPQNPAVVLTWFQISGFAQWLSDQTRRAFRLPTEAEWECTAKEGKDDIALVFLTRPKRRIHWQAQATTRVDRADAYVDRHGIRDMIGQAWVWTGTWHGSYPRDDDQNPLGPRKGDHRILRGASWMTTASDSNGGRIQLHPSYRGYGKPDHAQYNIGGRLVMVDDPEQDRYLS